MLLHFVGLSNKKSYFPKRGHLVIQKQHWFAIHFQHENKNYALAFIYQIKSQNNLGVFIHHLLSFKNELFFK